MLINSFSNNKIIILYIIFFIMIFIIFPISSNTNEVDGATSATPILNEFPQIEQKETPGKITKKIIKIDPDKDKISKIIIRKNEELRNAIELKAESQKENKEYDNSNKKSIIIIFENSNENIPYTLSYDYSEEKTKDYRYYELDSFIPKTIDDFNLSKPEYIFDSNGIIKNGKIKISTKIGEPVFWNAYDLYKKNELKNAVFLYQKLIYYNYKIAESSYYISLCYYLDKNYIAAINYLGNAILRAKDNALSNMQISSYYYQIGKIYNEINEYKLAFDNYNLALETEPINFNVYNGMGLTFYKIGEINQALDSWKKGMAGGDNDCKTNYLWLSKKIGK